MTENYESIIDTKVRRRADALRLTYHAVDEAGLTTAAWGLEVEGDLPLHPWALRHAIKSLPWPDGFDSRYGPPDIHQIEHRGASEQIAHFIVEASPEAFYSAAVTAALAWVAKQLKPYAKRKWSASPHAVEAGAEMLMTASRRAKDIALDTYRDIEGDLVVLSESLSEPADPDDASAMIVMRASDGSIISAHIWLADGMTRHTITRAPP